MLELGDSLLFELTHGAEVCAPIRGGMGSVK